MDLLHIHVSRTVLSMIVAVVLVIMGVLTLLSPVMLYLIGVSRQVLIVTTVLMVVFGAAYILAGYGLYRGTRWGWVLSLILISFNIVGAIAQLLMGIPVGWITLAINSALLILLLFIAGDYIKVLIQMPNLRPTSPSASAVFMQATFVRPVDSKRFVRRRR